MRIEIEIPKEFEKHFNQDKFKDSLERIMADIEHSLENGDCLCAGRYEYETIEMLEKAFENSKMLPQNKTFNGVFGGDYTTDNKLKVFLVTRKADWCEDNAIVVLAIDKLHAERCARCNSRYFSKGEVKVKEIKMDEEKVVLISNMGA